MAEECSGFKFLLRSLYFHRKPILVVISFVILIRYILLVICVLVGVAFLTLIERKVLGYIQIRKGPNKVGYVGILQPFSDAIKLFTKEQTYPTISNFIPYYLSPVFSLFVSLIVWLTIPYEIGLFNFSMGTLFFLCCTSLGVYTTIGAGWSSNSKYSLLGRLRAVAQTISYEVRLALILLSFIILVGGFNLGLFSLYQRDCWFVFLTIPLSLIWFASCLAETNRTPFDFAEGESELVSGFNIEYGRLGFALIFMAEYARIFLIGLIFSFIFITSSCLNLWTYFFSTVLVRVWVWVRTTFPRYRYDKLIALAWKVYLPLTLYSFFYRIFNNL